MKEDRLIGAMIGTRVQGVVWPSATVRVDASAKVDDGLNSVEGMEG